eukprot:13277316-Alexandrium_andersonii.AAC.1
MLDSMTRCILAAGLAWKSDSLQLLFASSPSQSPAVDVEVKVGPSSWTWRAVEVMDCFGVALDRTGSSETVIERR